MGKVNSNYETLFVISSESGEDGIKAAVEKFVALIEANGTITEKSEWGKRRLAYPINDLTEGYYVLVNFNSTPEFPAELERIFNISDVIIRSLVIKK